MLPPRRSILTSLALPLTLAGTLGAFGPTQAHDASPTVDVADELAKSPDGFVSLSGGVVAVGVGYSWGHGALDYEDARRKFTLQGLSVVDIGAARVSASGFVYHLLRLEDFAGTYTAFSAGATVAGGAGVVYLKNDKGVVLKLKSATQGLRFNISPEGIHIKLAK